MNPIFVKTFNKGLITRIEDKDAARGSASDMLNWHVLGDHIELRRGRALLGTEVIGATRVSGLLVARRHDGLQIPFYTYARKCLYYDAGTDANIEVSSDLLPTTVLDADGMGEDVSFAPYSSLAGDFAYFSSPNSSIYKIPTANPGSVVDLLMKEYRGKIKIKQSRTFLWDRKDDFGGSDQTGLYLSHIDATDSVYQFTSAEVLGTGDGVAQTFSGTLAFKGSAPKETAFFLVIAGAKSVPTAISSISQATAAAVNSNAHGLSLGDTVVFSGAGGMTEINSRIGVVTVVADANNFTVNIDTTNFTPYTSGGNVARAERFIDDRSGNLRGQDGGTGTINYATGAYSITFNTAVVNGSNVVAQYFREDSTREVSGTPPLDGGIMDFSYSVPRGAGEGNVFRQDDGGKFMTALSFGDAEYCIHEYKTWALTINPADDTTATNLTYRENVGIPYHRAACATGSGIYYIDSLGDQPAFRILEYGRFSNQVIPRSISDALDLRPYSFDRSVVFEWGDYILFACRTQESSVNNRLFAFNKVWNTWEIHSYRISCLDVFNGALLSGDSASPNMLKLFSGLTDEDSNIENFYITNDDNLNKEGVKRTNRMKVAGFIGIDQKMKVSYSTDNDPFVEINRQETPDDPLIEGNGSYVDLSRRTLIGNVTLGEDLIGGGQDPVNAIYASPYELEFHVGTKKFQRIRLKFEATGAGYLSVSEYGFVDNRDKGRRLPTKWVSTV